MNTPQAKMFIRSLNNSSAKIIMAFLFAKTALDVKELRVWTGIAKRETIYNALEDLKALGMVENQSLAHGRHVWLPAGDLLPGFRQMSAERASEIQVSDERTPELPDVPKTDSTTLLVVGGDIDSESINLTPPTPQMSAERTSDKFPDVLEILRHTDLLFDGDFVMSRDLADRQPLDALAWCAYAYSRKSKLSGPGGMVRRRLLDNEDPPEWAKQQWQETLPDDFLEVLGLIEYTCDICQAKFGKQTDLETHIAAHPQRLPCPYCDRVFEGAEETHRHIEEEHTPKATPIDPSINMPIEGSHRTPEQAWQEVLERLPAEMPRGSFQSLAQDTQAVRYDGNTLYVGVRNNFAATWMRGRLTRIVDRLLFEILGMEEIHVEFVASDLAEANA